MLFIGLNHVGHTTHWAKSSTGTHILQKKKIRIKTQILKINRFLFLQIFATLHKNKQSWNRSQLFNRNSKINKMVKTWNNNAYTFKKIRPFLDWNLLVPTSKIWKYFVMIKFYLIKFKMLYPVKFFLVKDLVHNITVRFKFHNIWLDE